MGFDLHHPASLKEACDLASRYGADARFIAGGTDLIIQISRKTRDPAHLIALSRIEGLDGITEQDDRVVIGALTTHKTIERHSAFDSPLAAIREAARVVGGHQVRNMATIGGNVANASPAADLLPPLLALDAMLELRTSTSARSMALREFLRGPSRTDCRAGEIITTITIPRPPAGSATAFLKAGRRKAMEISIVSVAAALTIDPASGRCRRAAIALGAVAPTAIRVPDAEAVVEGALPGEELFAEAGNVASRHCSPISDVRASARYRTLLVRAMVARALAACTTRIAAGGRADHGH